MYSSAGAAFCTPLKEIVSHFQTGTISKRSPGLFWTVMNAPHEDGGGNGSIAF